MRLLSEDAAKRIKAWIRKTPAATASLAVEGQANDGCYRAIIITKENIVPVNVTNDDQ